jgi:hypothetical protein
MIGADMPDGGQVTVTVDVAVFDAVDPTVLFSTLLHTTGSCVLFRGRTRKIDEKKSGME